MFVFLVFWISIIRWIRSVTSFSCASSSFIFILVILCLIFSLTLILFALAQIPSIFSILIIFSALSLNFNHLFTVFTRALSLKNRKTSLLIAQISATTLLISAFILRLALTARSVWTVSTLTLLWTFTLFLTSTSTVTLFLTTGILVFAYAFLRTLTFILIRICHFLYSNCSTVVDCKL